MRIVTYTVSKRALMNIPVEERDFFLLAGHLANEIIFLSKLSKITENRASKGISAKAELIQALFVHKILVGKLYEGWQMIRRCYFGTSISKTYDKFLANEARDSIKELGKYFGKDSLIKKVRDAYSFHYSANRIDLTLKEMEDGDEFDMYIADQHINSMYYISESIVNKSMLYELGEVELQNTFDKLYHEMIHVHALLLDFINNFMQIVVGRYFVMTESNPVCEELVIDDYLNLNDLRIPFFVNTPS